MHWIQNKEITSLTQQTDTDQKEREDQWVLSENNSCTASINLSLKAFLEKQFYNLYKTPKIVHIF